MDTALHHLAEEIRTFIHDCIRLQEQAFSGTIRELKASIESLKIDIATLREELRSRTVEGTSHVTAFIDKSP